MIAVGVVLPFNPALLVPAVVGSTAPDWSEWILKFFGIQVEHRRETHYLLVPLAIMFLGALIIPFSTLGSVVYWFGIGYLTHWFADSLTISGVPLSPWDRHRIHFFGGKLRTGRVQNISSLV